MCLCDLMVALKWGASIAWRRPFSARGQRHRSVTVFSCSRRSAATDSELNRNQSRTAMHTPTARPTAKPGDAAGSGCPPDISSVEVPFRTPLVAISVASHYELYHNWQISLAFCRTLPDIAPPEPTTFHMFWRERRGRFWRKRRRFGRRQALSVKAFFATQDLSKCALVLWSDQDLSQNEWLRPFRAHITFHIYGPTSRSAARYQPHWKIYRQRDARVIATTIVPHSGAAQLRQRTSTWIWCCCAASGVPRRGVSISGTVTTGCAAALMSLRRTARLPKLIRGRDQFRPASTTGAVKIFAGPSIEAGRRRLPSTFFDTEWYNDHFELSEDRRACRPLRRRVQLALAYRWDEPIETGSKFQLLEARVDDRLTTVFRRPRGTVPDGTNLSYFSGHD